MIYTVCTCSVFGTIVLSMSWYDLWLVSEYSSHQSSKQSVTSPSVIIMMTTQILATNSIYCMTRQFPEMGCCSQEQGTFCWALSPNQSTDPAIPGPETSFFYLCKLKCTGAFWRLMVHMFVSTTEWPSRHFHVFWL